MEKKEKIKKEKAPKAPKKSKMPEGYIGRPKPMKTKTFQWRKPRVGEWIGIGVAVIAVAFVTYIVIRLIDVSKVTDVQFDFYAVDENAPEKYVLENKDLHFELDTATTNISVTQKDTGHVWRSSPVDVDSDPIALGKEKNLMKSPIHVKYSTENGVENVYDVKSFSIDKKFYNVEKKNNEIRVNYTIGQIEREYKYPLAIYEKDMKVYLSKMTKKEQDVITKRCYSLVDIKRLKADQNKDEFLAKYPRLDSEKLYLVFDPLVLYLKVQCEEIFERIGFTYDEYLEYKELYKEKNEKEVPAFNVTVSYKLDGNRLIVDVPFDEIAYKHTFPIVQLSVLPYFGAAGTSDNGFLFVPEGGGSLINFNNGKIKQNGYYADVYGWDYGSERKAVIKETRTAFPVFGEANNGSSFISIIENGAAYAGITADISGRLNSYNFVRADYKMIHGEQFEVSSRTVNAQYSFEPYLPKGESITQIYSFIPSDSYVDMAKEYRNYLFKGEQKLKNDGAPLAIEIVGAVDKVQQVAGMPKTLPYKLTTYAQAEKIIKEVEDLGIKNVSFKLSGFFNGGISQKFLNKFKTIKSLGGNSDFKKMVANTKDTSSKVYIDGSMQFAYRSGFKDGYNRYTDSARFASDELCKISYYSPIWYGKLDSRDTYYLVSPENISKSTDLFTAKAKSYGFDGISYRDNGYLLSGDYNERKLVSRSASGKMQVEKMADAKKNGLGVMINGGNDYAIKEADFATNMELHGNNYAILDTQVPFYQIALHGYRNFAGSAINLGYEKDQIILEAAESGAGLFFTVMSEPEKKLQETNYSEYYAACFDVWKPQINEIYTRYNNEVGVVANSLISNHEYLNNTVTATSFDNGYKVYVNFGYVDYVTESGVKVPARDYKVMKEVK